MIKKLMSYIGEYKRDTLLSPISVTFEVILEVLLPMLMAKVIDNGVEAGNMTRKYNKERMYLLCQKKL